jgi:hypothetical protein
MKDGERLRRFFVKGLVGEKSRAYFVAVVRNVLPCEYLCERYTLPCVVGGRRMCVCVYVWGYVLR